MNGLEALFEPGRGSSPISGVEAQDAPPPSGHLPCGSPTRHWSVSWFVLAAVAFGLICRVSQYAANASLWHDEAYVALNVLHKTFAGLLGPLDWNEPSPPGFLLVEKLTVSLLGRSEYALRLVPLLAGLAGVVAFAGFVRQVCGTGAAAFWAMLLMAASAKLIVQASTVKHFTLDLLWAVLLGQLAIRAWRLRPAAGALLAWGALGAAGLWLSYASLFVFAGTSLALTPRAIRAWDRRERRAYLGANLAVLASLSALFLSIRAQLSGELLNFWASGFPAFPDTTGPLAFVYWLGRSHLGFFNYFWQPLGAATLALALLGGVSCWRAGRQAELLLLWLPVWMALAASFLHRWPFGGNQHMVFAAPAALVLVAEGTETLRLRLVRWRWWAGWTCVALLMLPGIAEAGYRIFAPRQRHEVRAVIESVERHFQSGDQLLVFIPAEFEFYTGRNFRDVPREPAPSARVWLIASHSHPERFPGQVQATLDRLRLRRMQLQAIEEYGAAAFLFGPERDPIQGDPS